MPTYITDLKQADEVVCYMRNGLALEKARSAKGVVYRKVPSRTKKAGPAALTRFQGWVIANDTTEKVLHVRVQPIGNGLRRTHGEAFDASIHYGAFSKVLVLSEINYPAKEEDTSRPGSVAGFRGTAPKPFRTLVNVRIVT